MKKLYKKISSIIQNRKNELLKTSSSNQSFIQLSFSTQVFSSFSSSITNTVRIQYESDNRQNRYIDIRNQTTESRHDNRSFNSESRLEDRYDRESNRSRNRQYEFAEYANENSCIHQSKIRKFVEYAITRYADENLRSMNLIRRAQASEFYNSSSLSKINQSEERIIYVKKLSTLNKLYKNEEKFENTKNNFDFKLTIYLDKCKFADLSKHVYEKDVSLMLTSETLTYYYVNKNNFITFNDFCNNMRLYFEDSQ